MLRTAIKLIEDTEDHRRILRAVFALTVVVAIGTVGFVLIEGWGAWQALYFTLITITTVGYGDEGISETGKRFTTVLLLGGIATATYAFGQIVQSAVNREFAWRRKMRDAIAKLDQHFIVCGMGAVGRAVCERLAANGRPFVVIEADEECCARGREHGMLVVQGSATEDEVLIEAGIMRARGIACAVNSDSDNIVITLSARELNPGITIICRVSEDSATHKVERAGASLAVCPAHNGGAEIANVLIRPNLADFLKQSHGGDDGFQMGEVIIEPGSPLIGDKFSDYGMTEPSIAFVAVKRTDGQTIVRPGRNASFAPGDIVIVVGDMDAVGRMQKMAAGVGEKVGV